ncbi:cytochrome c [Tistlia consotensis]|uniref:Sulfur dehydrogenase subunit SoxD n=1 Tax=Tistlia consotensis USBA 355 TaxID=560819 RepID=A0A1Y6B347_9PROT|nr:cytochrome c [Tistlia consotensis]SME89044.1 sulfur dehydrogenase subunit SoxD [Tistlia consotensis USBA 355]SNR25619.1 cytochrome c [Tistlia consotensis]
MSVWDKARWATLLTATALSLAMLGGLSVHPARAAEQRYGLGTPATPEEIAGWNIDVRPDGLGLPEGSGSVADGEQIFLERCAACHGEFGEGAGRFPVLMGGQGTLDKAAPVKTIGSYWPYASTVWDYVHRAMPFGDAESLSADETYAVVAYLLNINDIVGDDFVLTKENLPKIVMPNAKGFFTMDAPEFQPYEPCMKDCKKEVKVIGHARVIDVTPDKPAGAGVE